MADLLVGRVIAGKFAIESPIGTGAMGAVYRARHVGLDKVVAVKVLHQALAKDPTFAARLQLEAKAASRLDHPNSVRVIDFGEEPDGLVYIAMELLDGIDLLHVIDRDWPLADERIVDLLSQTLSALAQAHDMGIVHRDLKPENIMLLSRLDDEGRPRDVVKVCDFGIAKIGDSGGNEPARKGSRALTMTGMIIGTPEYMSPEQCRGESLDARSDLYSVGVILYQLMTGRVPFQADSALDVVLKHITEAPVPPSRLRPEVSPHLERICMRALQKSRDDRPSTAREMRAGLRTSEGTVDAAKSASTPRASSVVADTLPSMQRAPAPVPRSPPPSLSDQTHLTTTSTGLRDFRRGSRRSAWYWAAGAVAAVGALAATLRLRQPETTPVAASFAVASVATVPPSDPPTTPPPPPPRPTASPEPPSHGDKGFYRHRLRLPVPSLASAGTAVASPEPPPPVGASEPPTLSQAAAPPPTPPSAVVGVTVETRPAAAVEHPAPEATVAAASRVDPTKGRVAWSVSGAGGGATAGNVTHALGRASSAWQRCYEVGLAARASRLEGTTTMRLSCDDEGRIIGASFSGLDAADVNACIRAAATGITIPNADTGDAWATVVLTFKVLD